MLPGLGFIGSSHGLQFTNNRQQYDLGRIVYGNCLFASPGLSMIADDAVYDISSDKFDHSVLEDQGEYFFSRRTDARKNQRRKVQDAIRSWPANVTSVIHLCLGNDESELLYETPPRHESGHLFQVNEGGLDLFYGNDLQYQQDLGWYKHGHRYIYPNVRTKMIKSCHRYITKVLDFYAPFPHINTIYICGGVERVNESERKLLVLWQLFNKCLEDIIQKEVFPVTLIFIPLTTAFYNTPHPVWSSKCSRKSYKVHRSLLGYKLIYDQIHGFITDLHRN